MENRRSLKPVKGVAYLEGGKAVITPRRPLIKDVDAIPMPAFHLFPIEYYRLLRFVGATSGDFSMPVLSGRGCTFKCTFCYRMDQGFRPRSNEAILEEIRFLNREYGINFIVFSDELLMSSEERTESLCSDLVRSGLKLKWTCNGRLNYAKPALLRLMKEAGCTFINYGIEAMDDQVLKNMKKGLNTKQIVKGIEATLASGISPGFNIIFGNVGDSRETLKKGVDFLLKYDDAAQLRTIRPVTPYPGCPLYHEAVSRGLVKDCEDFYENRHTNSDLLSVNFTDLSDEEFHEALYEANRTLIAHYYETTAAATIRQAEQFYRKEVPNFRGFRQV